MGKRKRRDRFSTREKGNPDGGNGFLTTAAGGRREAKISLTEKLNAVLFPPFPSGKSPMPFCGTDFPDKNPQKPFCRLKSRRKTPERQTAATISAAEIAHSEATSEDFSSSSPSPYLPPYQSNAPRKSDGLTGCITKVVTEDYLPKSS